MKMKRKKNYWSERVNLKILYFLVEIEVLSSLILIICFIAVAPFNIYINVGTFLLGIGIGGYIIYI